MIPRRVAAAWDRIHRTHPEPTPLAPTLAQQRLPRLVRVTRVALRFDAMWATGLAAKDIEKFDAEFLKHLDTLPRNDRAALYVRAAAQLEVQS
jgi:hypothetical protein